MKVNRVGIIVKRNSDKAQTAAEALAGWLAAKGIQSDTNCVLPEQDVVITLGGDGTLLHIAAEAGEAGIPVLGINMGDLGFLTEVAADDRYTILEDLFSDRLTTRKRMLLAVRCASTPDTSFYALNEVLVTRKDTEQIMGFNLDADDEFITTYRADGLIFATPTGSTAYNLSAGGPIVDPRMEAIVVTPICPFMLGSRPLVLPATVHLSCTITSAGTPAKIIVDGRPVAEIQGDDILKVEIAEFSLQLACPTDASFFEVLRSKLHWGGQKICSTPSIPAF